MPNEEKKIIYSALQPSGHLTLGNYIGALRSFIQLQEEFDCVYAVADLHALTVRWEPKDLRQRCLEVIGILLSIGIDPERSIVYAQSQVQEHAYLSWILGCYTYMGELQRMTQFKDKSEKHADNINAGLFTYPVLMASDILLYQTDLVPIGADQKQHLEIARNIAIRFNNLYGETFRVPEPYIPKVGARVMSLSDPTKKMSKSDEDANSAIGILDEPDLIRRKLRRAVTDSLGVVRYDPENQAGVSNLMSIYSALTGESFEAIEARFEGKGYGALKEETADAVIAALEPIQKEYARIRADKAYLENVLHTGMENAQRQARRTISKVVRKIGLTPYKL